MIVCPRCSKENQDHYKFCLGCGAELPRNAAHQPKSFSAPTPPAGMPQGASPSGLQRPYIAPAAPDAPTQMAPPPETRAARPEPASAPAAPAPISSPPVVGAAAGDFIPCPKCGTAVPRSFKFCGSCGHPMAQVASSAAVAAPAAAAPAMAPAQALRGNLVLIRPDGSEGEAMPLAESTAVGRDLGGVFASDLYLSPRHAVFQFEGDDLIVADEDSLNGVYVRIDRDVPTTLEDGTIFRIGQELIRFTSLSAEGDESDGVEVMGSPNPGYLGRLSLVIGRTTHGNSFPVPLQGLHLGRERGDLVFPEDGYVSGLHARVYGEQGKVFVVDVGSSNGTFVRVNGKQRLRSGDLILMGQQLFRAEY